jgi:hypothetical protein
VSVRKELEQAHEKGAITAIYSAIIILVEAKHYKGAQLLIKKYNCTTSAVNSWADSKAKNMLLNPKISWIWNG